MKIPAAKAAVDKKWEKLEKISAWNLTKVRSKKEVIDEARKSGATVHFASLMDICHLKNAELEAKHQKYKGRVVLRGDIVKDDSGSYAVFTDQGSSASQMTAAKVMDVISRLPGCAGQAADAVSAYTKVKNGGCTQIIANRNVQTLRIVYHDTSGPNHGPVWKTQSFLSSAIFTVTLWQDCYGKSNLRKSFCSTVGWRFPHCECLFANRQKGFSFPFLWTISKLSGRRQKSWSDVETTQQRSRFGRTIIFPWSCILGMYSKTMWSKQRYCRQYRTMFESRICAGSTEKLPCLESLRISSWSSDIEGHAKKCVERYCELANKTTQQLYKVSTPCIDDHHFKEEEMTCVGGIVECILSNCSEMLILGTNWKTRFSMVSEKACTIDYKWDQSL